MKSGRSVDASRLLERKTLWVVLLTAVTMVMEIVFGLTTRSMALLADGIHMGSHVLAIGLSWVAYVYVRKTTENGKFTGNPEKVLSLSGYSSGLMLLIFALVILAGAIRRGIEPIRIDFKEAIIVACIGLIVNIISAFILHHDKSQSDHNIRAAYLHVLADALTSVSAIIGLAAAWTWNIPLIDAIAAMLSSFVIIRWSIGLLIASAKSLLDITKPEK